MSIFNTNWRPTLICLNKVNKYTESYSYFCWRRQHSRNLGILFRMKNSHLFLHTVHLYSIYVLLTNVVRRHLKLLVLFILSVKWLSLRNHNLKNKCEYWKEESENNILTFYIFLIVIIEVKTTAGNKWER